MAGPSTMLGAPATGPAPQQSPGNPQPSRTSLDRDAPPASFMPPPERGGGLQPPAPSFMTAMSFGPRASSLAHAAHAAQGPGSFSSDLRGQLTASRAGSRADLLNNSAASSTGAGMGVGVGSGVGGGGGSGGGGGGDGDDDIALSDQKKISALRESLNREIKMKEGSENMLEALNSKKAKGAKEQRQRVEAELNSSNQRIKELRQRIDEMQRTRATAAAAPSTPTRHRGNTDNSIVSPFPAAALDLRSPQQSVSRSGAASDADEPAESPTFALAELLQALEVGGMMPEHYVSTANELVNLFKRHPTIKYDLVWSAFGLRVQALMLSESREVVAAAYRMTRYAISDIASLRKIRALNTDYRVVTSLVKDRKDDVEREQALKFVRAFLDVKDGIKEVSQAIVRTIVAIAEEDDDRRAAAVLPASEADKLVEKLRPISIETLAEMLIRDPPLVTACGGLAPLLDALVDGTYKAPESLVSAFLFLLDSPRRRVFVQPGCCLDMLLPVFTDQLMTSDAVLHQNSRAVAAAMRSWPGLMTLCMCDLRAVRSLIASIQQPHPGIRDTVLDLLYSLLRIKSPAWASTFLAGRRLTTYGRVANLRGAAPATTTSAAAAAAGTTLSGAAAVATAGATTATAASASAFSAAGTPPLDLYDDEGGEQNFLDHYTALLLAVLVRAGLLHCLLNLTQNCENATLKRKATLLIGEVLRLSSRLLPPSWSSELQLLPELFAAAVRFDDEKHFNASAVIYQISSVSRTLYRSAPGGGAGGGNSFLYPGAAGADGLGLDTDHLGGAAGSSGGGGGGVGGSGLGPGSLGLDDATFRQLLLDTGVLNSSNYAKWDWDIMLRIIDGPLHSGKRLEEASKASKFMKRVVSFYRPFKYKFSEVKSTRGTQKYVRVGTALMYALLQSQEGVRFLADSKLLRQVAECLAQCDPTSGLTAQYPMFSRDRLVDTLCGGYFPMLGVLSGDPHGLALLDRWRMFNMMYHIVDLKQRPDLIRLLLSNFDYSMPGHPRVLLSKAMTAGTKDIRIHATDTLRKYAVRPVSATPMPMSMSRPKLRPRPTSAAGSSTAFVAGAAAVTADAAADDAVAGSKWAIQLLVTQLYDPEIDVCATAVKILEKACNRKPHLEYIVECRPSLDHLGEIGAPLLLRFLSTSVGYHYLDGLDYISNEMDDWFLGRNDAYVSLIEASLARAFLADDAAGGGGGGGGSATGGGAGDDGAAYGGGGGGGRLSLLFDGTGGVDPDLLFADGHVPPHFYRELTRTQEGCGLLRDKGHLDEFAATIREHGMRSDDAELMTKVKGCLWAVGNVGSMEMGAPFLEDCDVVADVVRIAQGHDVMSMRGTAFFVLGLISRSTHGLEILLEHGWDANTGPAGASLGFCIPSDLGQLFSLRPWQHLSATRVVLPDSQRTQRTPPPPSAADRPPLEEAPPLPLLPLPQLPLPPPFQPPPPALPSSSSRAPGRGSSAAAAAAAAAAAEVDKRIIELVVDLGNTVLYKRAFTELKRIKYAGARGLRDAGLWKRVMGLLEWGHYRLAARRLVGGLFEAGLLGKVMLGESDGVVAGAGAGVSEGSETSGTAGAETADEREETGRG